MRPRYIVLCGTHSVGKTTLMNELRPKLEKKLKQSVSVISGVPDIVAERFPINEAGTEATQFALEAEFLRVENRHKTRHKLADRCILDRAAYSRANKLNLDGYYGHLLPTVVQTYDLIFYLPIEDHNVQLKGNGVRSSDPKYRVAVQDHLEAVIREHKVPVHILGGDLDDRVYQAMRVVDLYIA